MTSMTRSEPGAPRGFTLIELVAALLILTLLAATFVPYAMSLREASSRLRCAQNLKNIKDALSNYAAANNFFYPRTRFDAKLGNAWTAFSAPDDRDPFSEKSEVKPNDVSASLWLLVREGLAKPEWFVCPSSGGDADRMLDASGAQAVAKARGNFREPRNLTYAYATPFSSIEEYRLNDTLPARFVLVADQGRSVEYLNLNIQRYTVSPATIAAINSANHRSAGQNVLYADGSVSFETSPYCGVGRTRGLSEDRRPIESLDGDNIYTALSYSVLVNEQPKHNEPGVAGLGIGPAYRYDTYLVPPADYKPE